MFLSFFFIFLSLFVSTNIVFPCVKPPVVIKKVELNTQVPSSVPLEWKYKGDKGFFSIYRANNKSSIKKRDLKGSSLFITNIYLESNQKKGRKNIFQTYIDEISTSGKYYYAIQKDEQTTKDNFSMKYLKGYQTETNDVLEWVSSNSEGSFSLFYSPDIINNNENLQKASLAKTIFLKGEKFGNNYRYFYVVPNLKTNNMYYAVLPVQNNYEMKDFFKNISYLDTYLETSSNNELLAKEVKNISFFTKEDNKLYVQFESSVPSLAVNLFYSNDKVLNTALDLNYAKKAFSGEISGVKKGRNYFYQMSYPLKDDKSYYFALLKEEAEYKDYQLIAGINYTTKPFSFAGLKEQRGKDVYNLAVRQKSANDAVDISWSFYKPEGEFEIYKSDFPIKSMDDFMFAAKLFSNKIESKQGFYDYHFYYYPQEDEDVYFYVKEKNSFYMNKGKNISYEPYHLLKTKVALLGIDVKKEDAKDFLIWKSNIPYGNFDIYLSAMDKVKGKEDIFKEENLYKNISFAGLPQENLYFYQVPLSVIRSDKYYLGVRTRNAVIPDQRGYNYTFYPVFLDRQKSELLLYDINVKIKEDAENNRTATLSWKSTKEGSNYALYVSKKPQTSLSKSKDFEDIRYLTPKDITGKKSISYISYSIDLGPYVLDEANQDFYFYVFSNEEGFPNKQKVKQRERKLTLSTKMKEFTKIEGFSLQAGEELDTVLLGWSYDIPEKSEFAIYRDTKEITKDTIKDLTPIKVEPEELQIVQKEDVYWYAYKDIVNADNTYYYAVAPIDKTKKSSEIEYNKTAIIQEGIRRYDLAARKYLGERVIGISAYNTEDSIKLTWKLEKNNETRYEFWIYKTKSPVESYIELRDKKPYEKLKVKQSDEYHFEDEEVINGKVYFYYIILPGSSIIEPGQNTLNYRFELIDFRIPLGVEYE